MKIISWLLGLIVIFLALAFALNNQQTATLNLWPFGVEVAAPLYLLSLGTLFLGLLLGAVIGWLSHLPHRMEARRLRKDIAGLRDKIEELQLTATPQEQREDLAALPRPKPNWRFWRSRS